MFRISRVAIVGVLAAVAAILAVELAAQPPVPTFSIDDVAQAEGNSGTSTFTFTVTLANPPATETRVRFATAQNTAAPSLITFSTPSSTVTIPGVGTGASTGAPASVYPISLMVNTLAPVRNVRAGFNGLSHTFPTDIDILLVGPGGQEALVLSDVGGGTDAVNEALIFSERATAQVGLTLESGSYLPSNIGTSDQFPAPAPAGPYGTSLAVFDNANPNGTWNVFIVDDAGMDTGSVQFSSLTFETGSSDYFSNSGELVFPAGLTTRTVGVTVLGNAVQETNERFVVNLSNPTGGAALGDAQGIGHILNDDGGGTAPTAVADGFQTPIGASLSVPAPGVLANDNSNGGGALSAVLVTNASHGTVSLDLAGSFLYQPAPGFFGVDSFSYRAINTLAQSGVATVAIAVGAPPSSVSDAFSTAFNTTLGVGAPGVLANDNTNASGTMTAVLASTTAHGALALNSNGSFVYSPTAGFHGTDSFVYRAQNAVGAGALTTVTLTVGPPPTTAGDTFATAFETLLSVPAPGVLANDSSNGGGALSAVLVSSTTHGVLSLAANGSFTYTPDVGFAGSDSFTYRAQAAGPGNTATVSITVDEPTTIQPPTDLYVSALVGNNVTFRFTAPALGPDATGFVLEGGLTPGEVLASLPTGSASPIFTIDAPTGSFYVRVHATAGAEKSGASNEIRIHVNVPVPPSAPDRFTSAVNGDTLSLRWRNTFAGGPPASLVADVSGSATTQLPLGSTESLIVPVAPGGTYTLSLRAVNGGGSSPSSAPITVTIPSACPGPPGTPASFLAYRIGNTGFVVWEPAASGPAADSYVLAVSGSFVGSFPTTGRALSGQVGPGSYTVTVTAVNGCGASAATPAQTIVVP